MPRQSKPRYLDSRGYWYVQHKGRRHVLIRGPRKETAAQARKLFHGLMARLDDRPVAGPVSLGDLAGLYLRSTLERARKGEVTKGRHSDVKHTLKRFVGLHEAEPAEAITTGHLDDFLGSVDWAEATKKSFVANLTSCYRWGKARKLVACDPPKPGYSAQPRPSARRPEGAIPGRATIDRILEHSTTPEFAKFARFVALTGCRPGEAARIEAKDIRPSGVVVLEHHKTAKKTHRPRKIAVNPEAAAILAGQVALHPEGPVFRNSMGRPWSIQAWSRAFATAREAAGVDRRVKFYALRHAFATGALRRGMRTETVSKLLGHSNVTTTSRVYSDVDSDDEWLMGAAAEAAGE